MSERPQELTNFDLFVVAMTMVSLINIVWYLAPLSHEINGVVAIVDGVFSLAFLADFLLRLHRAPSNSAYFFRQWGWLDLLGSLPIPFLRLLRIVRLIRAYRPIRTLGPRGVWKRLTVDLAGSALLMALFLTVIVIQYAGMGVLWAEGKSADANIRTASDAVWWAFVTATTVGYGDRYPVTNTGRIVGVALLTAGVGLFSVLTGFLANAFLKPKRADPETPYQAALDGRLRNLEILIERRFPVATSQTPTAEGESATRDGPVPKETMP